MIKWYFSKFDSWLNKQTKEMDLSGENANKATLKDYWIVYKIFNSPVFWLFMLPLVIIAGPFVFLWNILEAVSALLLITVGVSFLISIYMILSGQGTLKLVLLCIGSGMVFFVYVIGAPLMRKSSWYTGKKKAVDGKIRSWLPF